MPPRTKKEKQMPFRVTERLADDLEKAAAATNAKVPELLREAADAIVRAHKRSRDGRVPKDMEIRPRYFPEPEDVNWQVAEAPGETINVVMAQSPREAAIYFAGRMRGEIITHPHFVHQRSRAIFIECVRSALLSELGRLAEGAAVTTPAAPLPNVVTKGLAVGAQPHTTEPGEASDSARK
jgi:hypothetical protein